MTAEIASAAAESARELIRRRARAHSRQVAALRVILPAAIIALLGLLGAFVIAQAVREAAAGPKETPTQIQMISPHFIGRDDQGRDFNLTARIAVRDDADLQRVRLAAPVLVYHSGSDRPRTLRADRGVYDESSRLLWLYGHVRGNDAGSTLGTGAALVDTRAGTVKGLAPLTGAGAQGSIEAGSYTATEKGGIVIMHGGVHARLNGKAGHGPQT